MGILLKYILHNIQDRKMRTIVMLLSIVLSTTLLFVSLSIGDSYAQAQRKMARGMAGSATLSVSKEKGTIAPESLPVTSMIRSKVGIIQSIALYKENGYYENFDILAADLQGLDQISAPRILEGSIDQFDGNAIVLPDRFTSKFGIEVGDPFTLWINGEPFDFHVAAIAAYDTVFLRHTRGTNALIPRETLAAITDCGDAFSKILIEPSAGTTTEELRAALAQRLPDGYVVSRIVNEAQVEASARQKSMPFFLISFFSLTMSVFIIFSSYKVITLERLPVIGTFRSIGASQQDVTRILLWESLIYGGMGALIGIPTGLITLKVLLKGLGNSLAQGIDIPMIVAPMNILVSCGVAMVVSLFSAWIPVKRASRLPVKDVVLGVVEEQSVSNRALLMIGAILFMVSVILPQIGRRAGDKLLFLTGGISLLGLLVSTILLIPMIASGVSRILEGGYSALSYNEGMLSARNLRGNKNAAQNITLLFISISAIIAISVVGNFVQMYIGDVFRGAKLDGFTDATMSPAFVEEIKRLDGIDETLPVQVMNQTIRMNETTLSRVEGTDDLAEYARMFAMNYEQNQRQEEIETLFPTGRHVLLSADCMKSNGIKAGDSVTLSRNGRSFTYTVLGSYKIRSTNTEAIIPATYAIDDFGVRNYGIVVYTADDPDSVMAQIRDLFGEESHWSRTVEEFNADALGTVSAFLQPMRNLTWFILLLAAVGVINNLLINHIQKQRITAMFQSVGMSQRQNIKITLLEALASGVIGAVIAISVSWFEIQTIFLVAGPKISMQPELDAGTFLFSGALGAMITLLGSVVPILKNKKLKIVEQLKFD